MVNGEVIHRNVALSNGDKVTFIIPTEDSTLIPEKDNLRIIYEDDTLLVVDKPAPMLTHPTVQSATGTLANLIAGHYLAKSQRCGIHPVSRLDRNTSGLVLLPKIPYTIICLLKVISPKPILVLWKASPLRSAELLLHLSVANLEAS